VLLIYNKKSKYDNGTLDTFSGSNNTGILEYWNTGTWDAVKLKKFASGFNRNEISSAPQFAKFIEHIFTEVFYRILFSLFLLGN
jgi:hypothetical protein